jgi:hypothetical protein
MKLLIKIIERRLDELGGPICDSGRRIIRWFKKDYPNGVKLTRVEFEKFIKKHKLTKFDVGVICNSLFEIYKCPVKASKIDFDFTWTCTPKDTMLNAFFKLAKGTKLLKK